MKKIKLNQMANFLWPDLSVQLIRIGPVEDGGYVLPASTYLTTKYIISFGVNVDWRFESELCRELKVPVELYEAESVFRLILRFWLAGMAKFLIGKIKLNHLKDRTYRFFHFFYFFAKPNVKLTRKWIDRHAAEQIFINCPKDTLFKCDIEGGEYDLFDLIKAHQQKFNIIAIEIHCVRSNLGILKDFLAAMKKDFYIIHFHANNSSIEVGDDIPDVVELTLARRSSEIKFIEPPDVLPIHGIDFPSVVNLPDFSFIKP